MEEELKELDNLIVNSVTGSNVITRPDLLLEKVHKILDKINRRAFDAGYKKGQEDGIKQVDSIYERLKANYEKELNND